MARRSKASYSPKQKRQARHVAESEMKSGKSTKTAQRIGWTTVNKQDGGAMKAGPAKKSSMKARTRSHASHMA